MRTPKLALDDRKGQGSYPHSEHRKNPHNFLMRIEAFRRWREKQLIKRMKDKP